MNDVDRTLRNGDLIDLFKTLPLWQELPRLNIVYACWHEPFMSEMAPLSRAGRTPPETPSGRLAVSRAARY